MKRVSKKPNDYKTLKSEQVFPKFKQARDKLNQNVIELSNLIDAISTNTTNNIDLAKISK